VTGALAQLTALGACAAVMSVAAASEVRSGAAARLAEGGLVWRVEDPGTPQPARRPPLLNTLRDVGMALEICWRANEPPLAQARPGMNVTVMLAFTRSGALLGEPRFTYITPEATAETRALYQRAVVAAINACTPLPISEALGNALAGSPKIMPFIDRRNQKGT
jgi:hypothetical protein